MKKLRSSPTAFHSTPGRQRNILKEHPCPFNIGNRLTNYRFMSRVHYPSFMSPSAARDNYIHLQPRSNGNIDNQINTSHLPKSPLFPRKKSGSVPRRKTGGWSIGNSPEPRRTTWIQPPKSSSLPEARHENRRSNRSNRTGSANAARAGEPSVPSDRETSTSSKMSEMHKHMKRRSNESGGRMELHTRRSPHERFRSPTEGNGAPSEGTGNSKYAGSSHSKCLMKGYVQGMINNWFNKRIWSRKQNESHVTNDCTRKDRKWPNSWLASSSTERTGHGRGYRGPRSSSRRRKNGKTCTRSSMPHDAFTVMRESKVSDCRHRRRITNTILKKKIGQDGRERFYRDVRIKTIVDDK